ncbi:hypothetical protein [Ruminococcus sp.]|uniref:hypothetical protein n=1 Tax=Ruminococcus sp. TaxID=41978 RepID=UPI001B740489|nr:hypothetical protein [Ruminococcus sp.]MBP5431977.1 hypothetical protein [Ruminococcus sp.]
MKKAISTVSAILLAATSISALSTSAIEINSFNDISFETNTVVEDMFVNGVSVPAGYTAITVNISNNTGFSGSTTKFELGDAYSVLLDENDELVISVGDVLEDSIVHGATNENLVAIASACGEDETSDGELFTFYASKDLLSNDDSIEIVDDFEDVSIVQNDIIMGSSGNYYLKGDVNDDDYIDVVDACQVLAALSRCGQSELPYSVASLLPNYYFPNIYVIDAAYIWSDNRNITEDNTANIITAYYTKISVGQLYPHQDGLLIGYAYPVTNMS